MKTLLDLVALLVFVSTAVYANDAQPVEQWSCYCGHSEKIWDDVTLRHRWFAAEMANIAADRKTTVVPALRDNKCELTGETRPPVRAVRAAAGTSFDLSFGELQPSCYVVRPIAMARTEDLAQYRKPLYIELIVTGPGGYHESYRQRVPYWDDFYSVTELFFNVDLPGIYHGELRVGKGSAVDLYVHAIELHDALGGLAGVAAKQSASLYSSAERDDFRTNADRAVVEAHVKQWTRASDPFLADPATPPLPPNERAARDRLLWDAFPPLNTQVLGFSPTGAERRALYQPQSIDAAKVSEEFGRWEWEHDWRQWWHPFVLVNRKLGLRYTRDDLQQQKGLPAPYPYPDDTCGVYLPPGEGMDHGETFSVLGLAMQTRWRAMMATVAPDDGDDVYNHLPMLYHALGHRRAARDAALLLVKWAHIYPAYTQALNLEESCIMPSGLYRRDVRLRARLINIGISHLQQGLAVSYDLLFDYIKGNDELAAAVHQFIPWVKTEEDVRRLIETRILQYGARQSLYFNIYSDHGSPTYLMNTALIQQDAKLTQPWMEFLWEKTWLYPHPRAGLPDYVSTTTQRDGSTEIGSSFYTLHGSPFAKMAWMSKRYIELGGDPRFDLTDPGLYGKIHSATTFPLDITIAGGFPMSIGDVGGPVRPRITSHGFGTFEETFRRGYDISGDPRLAWVLVHYFGRGGADEPTWSRIQQQAASVARNPLLISRPRVMSNWAGILEHGSAFDDFRLKTAVQLRIGTGHGHAHRDTLDLQLIAHGVRMMNDIGWRGSYASPSPIFSQVHNLVEVDEQQWEGHAWVNQFAPGDGLSYVRVVATPPYALQQAVRYRDRSVALIDVGPGREGAIPPAPLPYTNATMFDPNYTPSKPYVFDVERVSGGSLHTWCFHGTVADAFDVNMQRTSLSDEERTYLRRYLVEDELRYGGDAPETVTATWRLRRGEEVIEGTDRNDKRRTLRQREGERNMLEGSFDSNAPRKFTRVHLTGGAVDRLLVGRYTPITEQEQTTWPFLFGQRRGEQLESVFPAVIEPYVGEPFIQQVRALPVADNENDALRAVAMEVQLPQDRTDICFSDGRVKLRTVGDMTINGSFAFVSREGAKLRELMLVDGTVLSTSWGKLTAPHRAAVGTVERVNYLTREVWLTGDMAGMRLVGEQVELGNDTHKTSFGIIATRAESGRTVITLDKAIDLSYAHVESVDVAKGELRVNVMPTSMNHIGANRGLTLTNEDMTRSWRANVLQGQMYHVESLNDRDLKSGDVVRVWEFGVGDIARVPMRARVTRAEDGEWAVQSNSPVTWSAAR